MSWKEVPLPSRMQSLPKDKRGLPVPHIVHRDEEGNPKFNVNETTVSVECLLEELCPICGQDLDEVKWFLGGPLSAFHESGWYNDTAMHHDCMEYALKVCPWLAAPNYLARIDGRNLAEEEGRIYLDLTMLPDRPQVFVAVGSKTQEIREVGFLQFRVRPTAPEAYEFWQGGAKIDAARGVEISMQALEKFKEGQVLQHPKIVEPKKKKEGGS